MKGAGGRLLIVGDVGTEVELVGESMGRLDQKARICRRGVALLEDEAHRGSVQVSFGGPRPFGRGSYGRRIGTSAPSLALHTSLNSLPPMVDSLSFQSPLKSPTMPARNVTGFDISQLKAAAHPNSIWAKRDPWARKYDLPHHDYPRFCIQY